MGDQFISQEQRKISSIPHHGITKDRFRLISNQINWLRRYLNNDHKQIHTFRTNAFGNYEVWRKERAIEFKKEIPQQTTINQEMSCLRRVFSNDQFKKELELHTHQLETLTDWGRAKRLKPKYV